MHSEPVSYTWPAKALHWLMAALWIAAWIMGGLAVYFRDNLNPDHGMTFWHKATASSLLFLLVLRLLWRLAHRPPALPDSMSPAMQRLAHGAHGLLYALALMALPLSGWIWSSVADKPIMVLGLFQLPPLLSPRPEAYALARWTHVILAWGCGLLVAGHVAVALKHHWLDRDDILTRMMPGSRRP